MHAYLIITKSQALAEEKAREIVKDARIIPFNIAGIGEVRELARQTSVSFSEKTVFLIHEFGKASPEAQNAFLKSLEEAQENVVYVLTAKNEEAVLPTILSRCQVIRMKPSFAKAGDATLSSEGQGSKIDLETVAKITKREDAVEFLENLIDSLHDNLLENTELSKTLRVANETLARIQQNANPTLQLTWFYTQVSLQ